MARPTTEGLVWHYGEHTVKARIGRLLCDQSLLSSVASGRRGRQAEAASRGAHERRAPRRTPLTGGLKKNGVCPAHAGCGIPGRLQSPDCTCGVGVAERWRQGIGDVSPIFHFSECGLSLTLPVAVL